MKIENHIKESNYLLARAELVRQKVDAKSKRAVVVAAEKAREATTYIGSQLSDSQQVRLATAAIKKVFIENYPFDFFGNEYRIKQECKYRPYVSVDEAFNEAKKHGFWIRHIDKGYLRFIDSFSITNNNDIYLGDYYAEYVSDMFVWHDDDSPCCIKIK